MVSAWASADHLVLGQVAVDEKSNEITAIPALLDALLLQGCIVTIDAMGCQTAIAAQIVDKGADYVLALKENQGSVHHEVVHLFADAHATDFADYGYDAAETVDGGHGRVEIRRYWTISDRRRSRTSTPTGGGRDCAGSAWWRRSGGRREGRGR